MENQDNEKRPFKYYPTKVTLGIRLVVGAYLLYTSYKLLDGVQNGEGRERMFIGIFMILFVIVGLLLVLFSTYFLLKGRYQGGPADTNQYNETGDGFEETAVLEEQAKQTEDTTDDY